MGIKVITYNILKHVIILYLVRLSFAVRNYVDPSKSSHYVVYRRVQQITPHPITFLMVHPQVKD